LVASCVAGKPTRADAADNCSFDRTQGARGLEQREVTGRPFEVEPLALPCVDEVQSRFDGARDLALRSLRSQGAQGRDLQRAKATCALARPDAALFDQRRPHIEVTRKRGLGCALEVVLGPRRRRIEFECAQFEPRAQLPRRIRRREFEHALEARSRGPQILGGVGARERELRVALQREQAARSDVVCCADQRRVGGPDALEQFRDFSERLAQARRAFAASLRCVRLRGACVESAQFCADRMFDKRDVDIRALALGTRAHGGRDSACEQRVVHLCGTQQRVALVLGVADNRCR
jgi:hypothetical protein